MDLKKILKENYVIAILFSLTLILLLYQRATYIHWDFASYVLNAKYLFYSGTYFESMRPPLASVLIGMFLIFGPLANSLYTIFVSALFLYSIIQIADTLYYSKFFGKKVSKNLTRTILYFTSLTSFAIYYGLAQGTEMLALSLFILFINALVNNKISGHFLALAILSRYSFLIYTPILLINKDIKKILTNFATLFITLLPWLIYNRIKFGNYIATIINAYANNILFRQDLIQAFNFIDFLKVFGILLPFAIIGTYLLCKKIYTSKRLNSKTNIIILLTFLTLVITIHDYKNTPLKQIRYFYNLVFPIAILSTTAIIQITKKINKDKLYKILIILFIIQFILLAKVLLIAAPNDNVFKQAAAKIQELGIENCEVLSSHWVPVTYYTENVYPLGSNGIEESINSNKAILIFTNDQTLDDYFTQEEINSSPVLFKEDRYIILYNNSTQCAPTYTADTSYVSNHCEIISQKFEKIHLESTTKKVCYFFNAN